MRCHNVADLNAPASLCSSAALPAAAAAAGAGDPIFFYPLLLIGEQALRDTEGHLGLETFWQVVESRRFLSALLNLVNRGYRDIRLPAARQRTGADSGVYPVPGSQLISRIIDTFIALPTFLITLAFTFIYGSAGLLNGTLMSLFAFELPPVDFLYSIQGVILAEMTVFPLW